LPESARGAQVYARGVKVCTQVGLRLPNAENPSLGVRILETDWAVVGVTVDVKLEATPDAAAEARRALERFADRVPERRLRDVRLLVSELVTNAVRHAGLSPGDRIGLLVEMRDAVLRVEVDDPGSGFEPRSPSPDPARTSGWGLYLVEELSDRWGMDGLRPGTRIWFELDGNGAA
jgi:anti-sigma regulatory factor (Ser/Thr protein kinase)